MKKHIALFAALSLGLGFGCTHSAEQKNEKVTSTEFIETTDENEHHHSESDSIELNNGAKWKVAPEMLKHIRTMESDLLGFSSSKNPELKDFSDLAARLQKNNDLLTSNCTMQGKAHDELHKWLLPYLDLVDDFSKSTNVDEAKQTYKELMASYKTFNLYFE